MEGPIILTGAASGIGRAAALALSGKGPGLALVDLNRERLDEVIAQCQKHSARTRAFVCDVTDPAGVTQVCRQIQREFAGAGTLINCAGHREVRAIYGNRTRRVATGCST